MKCPTCNSPNPKLHPAMQIEGEVQICKDAYHRAGCNDNYDPNSDSADLRDLNNRR